jgi:hypothetical protein
MLGEALLTAILEFAIKSTVKPVRTFFGRLRLPKPAASWLPRLNSYLTGRVILYALLKSEPQIHLMGEYQLDDERRKLAKDKFREIRDERRPNDPHAILMTTPSWNMDPVYFEAQTLDFAAVRALRDETLGDLKPELLSSNAVIFCSETRQLILHLRSAKSDTFFEQENLHTMGGAYQPPLEGREWDKVSLLHTAKREVLEEAGKSLLWEAEPPMIIMKELETGFIQLAILGIDISANAADRLIESWEGRPVKLDFDDLQRSLMSDTAWVPTGKAAVLAWLALGAPNTNRGVRFSGLAPAALFNAVVN